MRNLRFHSTPAFYSDCKPLHSSWKNGKFSYQNQKIFHCKPLNIFLGYSMTWYFKLNCDIMQVWIILTVVKLNFKNFLTWFLIILAADSKVWIRLQITLDHWIHSSQKVYWTLKVGYILLFLPMKSSKNCFQSFKNCRDWKWQSHFRVE